MTTRSPGGLWHRPGPNGFTGGRRDNKERPPRARDRAIVDQWTRKFGLEVEHII